MMSIHAMMLGKRGRRRMIGANSLTYRGLFVSVMKLLVMSRLVSKLFVRFPYMSIAAVVKASTISRDAVARNVRCAMNIAR